MAERTHPCHSCETSIEYDSSDLYTCAFDYSEQSLDKVDNAADMAQQRSRTTQQDAQAFLAALAGARHRAVAMAEMVRERSARAQLDAAAAGDKLRAALAVWQSRLEKKAAAVCQLKLSQLHQQADQLGQMRGRVLALLDQPASGAAPASDGSPRRVDGARADGRPPAPADDGTHATDTAGGYARAVHVSARRGRAVAAAHHRYVHRDVRLRRPQRAYGEQLTVPVVGWPYHLVILSLVRDHYGADRRSGDDRMQARVVTADRRLLSCEVEHLVGGRARAAFVSRSAGEHTFSLTANGVQMMHSPWTRRAVSPRRLSSLGPVRLTSDAVCSEGTEPGQLCQPWGVAFGGDGCIVVSDPSSQHMARPGTGIQQSCQFPHPCH